MKESIYPQITQIDAGFFLCVFALSRETIYKGALLYARCDCRW